MELLLIYLLLGLFSFVSIFNHKFNKLQAIISLSYVILNYYADPNEKVKLALVVQIIAFSSILVYITLIPFDVYVTVNHYSSLLFNLQIYDFYFCNFQIFSYQVHLVDYCIMILLCFVFLPFTYFYADEALSSEDSINDLLAQDHDDEFNSD